MRRRAFIAERSEPLESAVAREVGCDAATAKRWIEHGAVYVRGRRCTDAKQPIEQGAPITVVLEEHGRSSESSVQGSAPLTVLFEDPQLIAVDKPAGVTAQPTEGRAGESLLDIVSRHVGHTLGLVHRLDRETSGVTVFAKTHDATRELARQFREGIARKRYVAICGDALPPSGRIELPISRDPSRPGKMRASKHANGAAAQTEYRVIGRSSPFAVVALFPLTGRTHQLRAHLAALGASIFGDALYGGSPRAGELVAGRCLLHAHRLSLVHPGGGPLALIAPVPEDMRAYLRLAGVSELELDGSER